MSETPESPSTHPADAHRRNEADEVLRRVRRESAAIGQSAYSGHEPVPVSSDDHLERWGKRIGRGLGAVVVVYLVWQLAQTLLTGH